MYTLRKQRGDTIVEVMIALAVLAMAFSLAYATANRSLLQARNAQEHTEALQYLSGQVELLRAKTDDPALFDTSSQFCMNTTDGSIIRPVTSSCTITPNGSGANYAITIAYTDPQTNGADQDNFKLTVTWPGVGHNGVQQEQLFYKVHQP